jgi:hypothetical protein
MGTTSSANAEWIELFNPGSQSVDLKGWVLASQDGAPSISLTGSIGAGGYYLLERTSDASVPDIAADQIYTGILSNVGEDLILRNASGDVIDEVNQANGWLGGDNTSKKTMQYKDGSWGTGIPTPRAANQITTSTSQEDSPTTLPETTTSSSSSDTSPTSSSNSSDDPTVSTSQGSQKVSASDEEGKFIIKPDPQYTAHLFAPQRVVAGSPIQPKVVVTFKNGGRDYVTGKFVWSMGDGTSYTFLKNTPFDHIYYYPGTYKIYLTYYSNTLKEEPDAIYTKTITVTPALVSLTGLSDDGGVVLHNDASQAIDLKGWKLMNKTSSFTFPEYTLIGKKDDLFVSSHTLLFNGWGGGEIVLINPYGKIMSHYFMK